MKKIIICCLLIFVLIFAGVKGASAISIADIRTQLNLILAKIAEIQILINQLKAAEEQQAGGPAAIAPVLPAVKSITITTPNGGDILEVGKTYDIKWNQSGFSANEKAQIKLIDDREPTDGYYRELTITNDTANSGSFSWKAPELLSSREIYGSLYKISVSVGTGSDKKTDTSDGYIAISKPMNAYVRIITPNGGENWQAGGTYTIKWDSINLTTSKITIDVIDQDGRVLSSKQIANNIANTGTYNWNISASYFGNYKIRITAYDNSGIMVAQGTATSFLNVFRGGVTMAAENQLASISQAIANLWGQLKNGIGW